jgi:hypothetical protein
LAIKDGENIEIYDTGNHRIFGVAQAQSVDQTLTFTSQDGLVRVKDLRKVLNEAKNPVRQSVEYVLGTPEFPSEN